ncbi:unnamed protein product [Trichobilharzia regenti]|nr:unnamed protein product [Trichobilharzia regenti]
MRSIIHLFISILFNVESLLFNVQCSLETHNETSVFRRIRTRNLEQNEKLKEENEQNQTVKNKLLQSDDCFKYRFPPNIRNPCLNYTCAFQAWCVPSADFKRPTCICYNTCYDVGDSMDKGPICGSDNRDYESICHLRREACTMMIDLAMKYRGKCGKL